MSKKDEEEKNTTVQSVKTFLSKSSVAILLLLIILIGLSLLWLVIQGLFPSIFPLSEVVSDINMLSANLKLLTLLIAIIALFSSYLSYKTTKEWGDFRKQQEEEIKKLEDKVEKISKEEEDYFWLESHIRKDPELTDTEDKEKLTEFADRFFKVEDELPLKYYLAGRAYENKYDKNITTKENLEKALEYYKKASGYDPQGTDIKKRIHQAKGTALRELGDNLFSENNIESAEKKYEEALIEFQSAFKVMDERYAWGINSMGNVYIKLAKLYEAKKEISKKDHSIEKALKCHEKAVDLWEGRSDWRADFHYDNAIAFALRKQEGDIDRVIEELENAIREDRQVIKRPYNDFPKNFENIWEEDEFKNFRKDLRRFA